MRKQIPLFLLLICLLTGFFLAYQIKVQTKETNFNAISQRNNNLIKIIQDLEKEIAHQEDQVETMRAQINDLQNQNFQGILQEYKANLTKAKIEAGLTPVTGKGLTITLDDHKDGLKANPTDDPNKYIIHYEHLLNLVNELKIGSAEALAINGQRLITTSEIRCVGNVILINMTRIAPPFVISAIGSPKLMSESISLGQLGILKESNFPITIEESENILIPAYKGDLQFKYTTPL